MLLFQLQSTRPFAKKPSMLHLKVTATEQLLRAGSPLKAETALLLAFERDSNAATLTPECWVVFFGDEQ